MGKTSQDFEREFLETIQAKTGRDLNTWLELIQQSELTKIPEIIEWLKKDYSLNHMQANFLAGIFRNDGKPVYASTSSMLDALFEGKKSGQRPLYEVIEAAIKNEFPAVQIVPAKAYVSFRHPREFACAAITPNVVRVGLDLGDLPFEGIVQKAKSLGAMPRISHMIEVKTLEEVDAAVVDYLKQANQRSNPPNIS